MKIIRLLSLVAMIFTIESVSHADLIVIVNNDNTYSASDEELRQIVKRLLLKKVSDWPGGQSAEPYLPKSSSPESRLITAKLYNLEESELEAYWARVKQTTGQSRPREVGSSRIIMKLVERDPGGVGIVGASAEDFLNDNVRILMKIPVQN